MNEDQENKIKKKQSNGLEKLVDTEESTYESINLKVSNFANIFKTLSFGYIVSMLIILSEIILKFKHLI